jgi:hypothetical protein
MRSLSCCTPSMVIASRCSQLRSSGGMWDACEFSVERSLFFSNSRQMMSFGMRDEKVKGFNLVVGSGL